MRKRFILYALCVILVIPTSAALAFNQPPLNLGFTNVLDQPPGPGLYFFEYIQAYEASTFKDNNGNDILPGEKISVLTSFNQLVWVSPHVWLGGNLGIEVVVPVASINTNGAFLSSNPSVFGDPFVGPFIQWFGHKLFERPYLHRFEVQIIAPLGSFNQNYAINAGSNIWTIEPYYSFTLFISPKLSTSWRIHYGIHTENDDTKIQPGQVFHFNYALAYELSSLSEKLKDLRIAAAGYYLMQTTEDQLNGTDIPDSEEQVFAIGPALFWSPPGKLAIGFKAFFESGAENRSEGTRTTLRFIWKF